MIYVYAIKSVDRNYIYVGMTDNVDRRFMQHQNGYEKTTKPYCPFILIYTEAFESRDSARKKEKYLKTAAGKRFLRSLL
jgi:putative endonuclease